MSQDAKPESESEVVSAEQDTATSHLPPSLSSTPLSRKRSRSPAVDSVQDNKTYKTVTREVNYKDSDVEIWEAGEDWDYAIHEGVPEMAASRTEYKDAERCARESIDLVVKHFDGLAVQGQEVSLLIKELNDARHIDYGKKVKVGLVGGTGAGKSRFTNALLGQEQLALQGANGKAVTQVITEYHNHNGPGDDIRVKVIFKSEDQIDAMVSRFFKSYVIYKQRPSSGKQKPSTSEEDIEDDHDDYDTARNFLVEVFAPMFSEVESCVDQMQQPTRREDLDGMIRGLQNKCRKHVDDLMESTPGGSLEARRISIIKHDLDDIRTAIRPFIASPRDGDIGYWQLVEKIETYLPSPVLSRGLVLADCPGLVDYHAVRREASDSYLKGCDMILVLADTDRIVSNAEVRSYIRKFIAYKGIHCVVILPTKVDQINVDEEIYESGEEGENIRKWRAKVAEIKTSKQQLDKDLPKKELAAKRRALEEALAKAHSKLEQAYILQRNKNIKLDLQCALPEGYKDQHLQVIPTSSKSYQHYTGHEDKQTCLDPGQDGIGEVRRLLYIRGQQGRLQDLRRFIDVRAKLPLLCLQMVLEKRIDERMNHVIDAVGAARATGQACIFPFARDTSKAFEVALRRPRGKHTFEWKEALTQLVNEWAPPNYHWSTIAAILRKDGVHKPKGRPQTNWNLDIVETLKPGFDELVVKFGTKLDSLQDMIVQDVKGRLLRLRDSLEHSAELGGIDIRAVLTSTDLVIAEFQCNMSEAFDSFRSQVRTIALNVAATGVESEFHDAMHEIYKSARSLDVKGGATRKRLGHVCEKLQSNRKSRFGAMWKLRNDVCKSFENVLQTQTSLFAYIIGKPFEEIERILTYRFGEIGDDLSEEQRMEIKSHLRQILPAAHSRIDAAKQYLDIVQQWEAETGAPGATNTSKKPLPGLSKDRKEVPEYEGDGADDLFGLFEGDPDDDFDDAGERLR